MARKIRVEFEGAIYHVMCRGDRRENIFEDDTDRTRFLATLGEVCERTGWRIHAYVLMSNHYHWLVETPRPNLVAGMCWFQTCFSVRYNRRHKKAGHLFQGRYKAALVDAEEEGYFATVSDYIHLNPARAGLIGKKSRLVDYRWSSLPAYLMGAGRRPSWLEVTRVLGALNYCDRVRERRAYGERLEERVREGMKPEELKEMRRGWLIGGERFRDQVLEWMEKRDGLKRRKVRREESDRDHGERQAQSIIKEMGEALGVTETELYCARKGDWRKRLIAHRVRRETSVTLEWLSGRLGMGSAGHLSRVAASVKDLERQSRALDKQLKRNARKKD